MSQKKVVGRNVAIVLGIVCIILVAGVGGVMAYYTVVVNDKNKTYDSYASSHYHTNSEYDDYVTNHTYLDSDYNSLSSQVNELNDTLNLGKSTIWVNSQTINQPADAYNGWWWWNSSVYPWHLSYAGYISVQVLSSTTVNTYVRAIYSVNGINYDNQVNVGSSGAAVFPVLPANMEIRVGNTDFVNGATETVTITYYY